MYVIYEYTCTREEANTNREIFTAQPYLFTKEPYISAKYVSAKREPYISTEERTCIYAERV